MATKMTPDEIQRAILDKMSTYKVGPGEIVPAMPVKLELDRLGVRSDAFNTVLEDMINKGLVELSGTFIKLTQAGFDLM